MAEWNGSVKAKCKKKIWNHPEIMVRRVYDVNRQRTSPSGVTCTIMDGSGGSFEMDSVEFKDYFTVIK